MRPMVTLSTVIVLCLSVPVRAEDSAQRIDADHLRKIGEPLLAGLNGLAELPLKIDPDLDKATGLKAGDRGAIVLPTKGLSAEALGLADKEVVPVGYLVLHRITPSVANQPLSREEHRMLTLSVADRSAEVAVIQLGVVKVAGRLVLVGYGSAETPAFVTTLIDGGTASEFPIDLEVASRGEGRAAATLTLGGKYRASLDVSAQD